MNYTFGEYKTNITISTGIPEADSITGDINNALIIADENTAAAAAKIFFRHSETLPICILKSGEENKNWESIEKILSSAVEKKLGRDCVFIAVGGGVICDMVSFAASIYMRGCRLVLIPTTLLAMVDASIGGKTGFDFCGIKNLAGTFYPAENIFIPIDCLSTLPQKEMKSGFAEILKTAVLAGGDLFDQIEKSGITDFKNFYTDLNSKNILILIEKSVKFKTDIVSEDLRETGRRKILNLGHTFGHALESALGLGNISHGEAVAWGIIRACEMGVRLGITPADRAKRIVNLIKLFGYKTEYSFDKNALINSMFNDKKKRNGKLTFIIPDAQSSVAVILKNDNELEILKEVLN